MELSGDQTRQMIDIEQAYGALRSAEAELRHSFGGSMNWKTVGDRRYLYRKHKGKDWVSLGRESEATISVHAAFHGRRTELKQRVAALDERVRDMARVGRAMRLGRVSRIAARILRRIDKAGVLGHGLSVAGTHALYAYERLAGVHYDGDVLATRDVDLLYDARGGLDLVASGLGEQGLIGLLRAADASFSPTEVGSFRAVNDTGFMVDLITPTGTNPATRRVRRTLAEGLPEDLAAVEIAGLTWLENAPSVTATVLDEAGYPLLIVAPDPRVFVCHKAWLATRDDRDPAKRRRDEAQAAAVARTIATYLPHWRFDDPKLGALPADLRSVGAGLAERVTSDEVDDWR